MYRGGERRGDVGLLLWVVLQANYEEATMNAFLRKWSFMLVAASAAAAISVPLAAAQPSLGGKEDGGPSTRPGAPDPSWVCVGIPDGTWYVQSGEHVYVITCSGGHVV